MIYTVPASAIEISGNTATPDEQQTLIIECRVIANPPAIFEWSRDGETLNDSRVSITYESTSTDEPTSTSILNIRNVTVDDEPTSTSILNIRNVIVDDEPTSTSILNIRNVTVDDGGNYICTAQNSLSSSPVSANFTVTVTGELVVIDYLPFPAIPRLYC